MSTTTLDIIVGATHLYGGTVTGGTTYNLSARLEYMHLENDGFGLPEFERFTSSGPLQDGATDRGYLLRPRRIQLVINTISNTVLEYWQLREQLAYIFTPRNTPLILKFTTPIRTYYLDCYTEGGVTFPSDAKQAYKGHKVTVQLKAPDPLWYYDGAEIYLLQGTQTLPRTTNFTYAGNYKVSPIIYIKGPISDPIVTNNYNSEKLSFSGYTVAAGTTIVIDTRYEKKTVTEQAYPYTNRIDKLTTDSDLATFSVYAPPEVTTAQYGVNGSGTAAATEIRLLYEGKYIGL